MKNFFTLRDLKNWLEEVPQEERKNCLCVIGGDDESSYLNLSTQVVDWVGEYSDGHSNVLSLDRSIEDEGLELKLVKVREDIKEVVVLDRYGYKMTAEDILRKIGNISNIDLPLFYDNLDLRFACEFGIGWAKEGVALDYVAGEMPVDNIQSTLECGVHNWHAEHHGIGTSIEDIDEIVDQEVPENIKMAFVIELYDGGCLCDLSIFEP